MRFPKRYTIDEIAQLLNCEYAGDPAHTVGGLNEIHRVEEGDLVFTDHPKYYDKALRSAAGTILINKKVDVPKGKAILISEDPFRDFNRLIDHFSPFKIPQKMHSPEAKIGKNTVIMPGVFIGERVVIGDNCRIYPGVVILDDTQIGNNVIVQANTTLGSLAFYYKKRENNHERLLSGGRLVIGDNVEIGAACTIDRGVSAETRIGSGTVIDNQVQIGHDTHIGNMCLFASQVGIAGCVNIGNFVTLWGQVGVTSGINIGDRAVVLAQSGISKSLEGGKTYFGYPAEDARKKYREMASIRVLPEIIERLQFERED